MEDGSQIGTQTQEVSTQSVAPMSLPLPGDPTTAPLARLLSVNPRVTT